jgi:fatty acid desaturase
MRLSSPAARTVESFIERALRVEHAANIGPLGHVLVFYACFALLVVPGAIVQPLLRAFVWVILVLLNYSLSIGVMHMHAHRALFTWRPLNRLVEVLLCFPSLLTATEMTVLHVHHHHRHNDGPGDVTSTGGRERGLKAFLYWISYGWVVKSYTVREIFAADAKPAWRKRRRQFLFDFGVCVGAALLLTWWHPAAGLWDYFIPVAVSHLTFGYFSWLTHAPAGEWHTADGSINNVDNLLNFFIFNQGFHAVHHKHPGIHWSDIPDKLEMMVEVDDAHIVPYWVTIDSSWRIFTPGRFRNAAYGRAWRARVAERQRTRGVRNRLLPYFIWI